jgi:hypothetical protein
VSFGAMSPGSKGVRSARLRTARPVARGEVLARLVGLSGDARIVAPNEGGAEGADVEVTVRAPETPGSFAGHVEIALVGEGAWRVGLRGEVVAPASTATFGAARPVEGR